MQITITFDNPDVFQQFASWINESAESFSELAEKQTGLFVTVRQIPIDLKRPRSLEEIKFDVETD